MANVATLNIAITAGTAQAVQGFNNVINRANVMGSAVTSASSRMAGFATSLAGVAIGAAGIGGAIGAMGLGVSAAAQAEQAQIAFETMLKSGDKAKVLLGDLNTFAAETPFELPGIVGSARKLLAFGEGADNIIPTLRALGDVSAGIGAPLEEIAELYGKARVQGRLMAEDINQLTGRGIPIIGQLAKQFGVAESEVRGLVEKGSVNFTHLQKAMISLTTDGGVFQGLMEKQSKSLGGLWSTAKDNVSMSLRGIAEAFIGAFDVKGMLEGLSNAAQYFSTEWVPWIRDTLTSVAGYMSSVWASISPTIAMVWDTVKTGAIVAFTTAQWAIQNWWDLTVLAATGALLGIVRFVENTKYFFGTVIPTLIAFGIDNWYELGTNMVNISATVISNLYENYTKFWKSLFDYMYGNSDGFEFVWTPLTDGFKNAVKNTLVIPEREMGTLETSLQNRVDGMAAKLRPSLSNAIADALADKTVDVKATNKVAEQKKSIQMAANTAGAKTAKTAIEAPKALLSGTKEAFEAIAAAKGRQSAGADLAADTAKNTADTAEATRQAADSLTKIADKLTYPPKVATGGY